MSATYDPQRARWSEEVDYCIDFDLADGVVIYGTSKGTHVGEAIARFREAWGDHLIVHDAYPKAFEEMIWGEV